MALTNAGAPIQLLFEAENHIITAELKDGTTYRGILTAAEDTMNVQLKGGNDDGKGRSCTET